MHRVIILVLLGCLILLLTGCASTSNMSAIPVTDSDFNKSLTEIRHEHSDVPLFEGWWRGIRPKVGDVKVLEQKWGPPKKIEKRWGDKMLSSAFGATLVVSNLLPIPAFLVLEAIFIYPAETHYWEKSNTSIEATVTRFGLEGYEPKLTRWKWEKIADSESSAAKQEALKQ